ncbi:hypothetical protein ACWGOK_36525 [Streptomyces eurythermus]
MKTAKRTCTTLLAAFALLTGTATAAVAIPRVSDSSLPAAAVCNNYAYKPYQVAGGDIAAVGGRSGNLCGNAHVELFIWEHLALQPDREVAHVSRTYASGELIAQGACGSVEASHAFYSELRLNGQVVAESDRFTIYRC